MPLLRHLHCTFCCLLISCCLQAQLRNAHAVISDGMMRNVLEDRNVPLSLNTTNYSFTSCAVSDEKPKPAFFTRKQDAFTGRIIR